VALATTTKIVAIKTLISASTKFSADLARLHQAEMLEDGLKEKRSRRRFDICRRQGYDEHAAGLRSLPMAVLGPKFRELNILRTPALT
jgi:hypothetical protein